MTVKHIVKVVVEMDDELERDELVLLKDAVARGASGALLDHASYSMSIESSVIRRVLPDDIREEMLADEHFLQEYAGATFRGSALEREHAREHLSEDDDYDLIKSYLATCTKERFDQIIPKLIRLRDPIVRFAIDAWFDGDMR